MSDVLSLHGLGAVVDVTVSGDAAEEMVLAMRDAWSRCLTGPATALTAVPIEVRLDDLADLPRRMMKTTQRVTRALIGAQVGRLLMFHAGAVSDPATGRSLVFVAAGGTGKTTLARLLGEQLGYVTDETVGIDAEGAILAYPKPLSVRRPGDPQTKDEVSPDRLGLQACPTDLRVGQLMLLDRVPSATGATFARLPFMDALDQLVPQSSSLDTLPHPLHALAELVDSTAPVLHLRYAEASDAVVELRRVIEGGA